MTILQLSLRGVIVFFIALLLIRISGRRSCGLHMALDNIITITLGTVLSRAIVGASEFLPAIAFSIVIVLLHRLVGWVIVHHPAFSKFVQGEKMILFPGGKFKATEEFSHLEIVDARIQMLLTGINGDLKNAADQSEIMQLLDGRAAKENMIHQGMVAPQFFVAAAALQPIPIVRGYHGALLILMEIAKAI